MWSECKLLSDKTKSNEKMSSKPMRLWKKRLLFVFFACYKNNLVDKSLGINRFSGYYSRILWCCTQPTMTRRLVQLRTWGWLLAILVSTLCILCPLEILAISGFPKMPSFKPSTTRSTGQVMHDNKGSKVNKKCLNKGLPEEVSHILCIPRSWEAQALKPRATQSNFQMMRLYNKCTLAPF